MYLALYRKYRPKTFEDVISQPHITTTLKHEVRDGKTAHAYLFTGPRGTGKTTCSKILAMAVNCEHPVDGNPCLTCESCRAIEQGGTLDVVEIDAASNNGVDNIRDLRDEANYTPAQCRYRVYIIDETHMLSVGAFNALLKIMEEPPEHVKFILATTEVHKVPATILSRCQRFDFRRIRPEDIKERLLRIAEEEPFTLSPDGAELIARLADGGMRDALSLLDQCAAFSQEITLDTVIQAAGVVGREYLYELTDCILAQDASRAILAIDRLYAMSKDMQGLMEELLHHFRNIMLTLTLKDPSGIVDVLPDEAEKLRGYAARFPLSTVLWAIGEMQACLDKMGRSTDRRLAIELCLVKLCTPSMNVSMEALASRVERLEHMLRQGIPAQSPAVPGQEPASHPSVAAPQAVKQKELPLPPSVEPPAELVEKPREETIVPAEQAAPPVSAETLPVREKQPLHPLAEWADVLEELTRTDMPLGAILRDSMAFTDGVVLYLDAGLSLAAKMIKQEGNAAKLLAAVESKTGVRYRLRLKKAPEPVEAVDPLTELLNRARETGIEVNEEN